MMSCMICNKEFKLSQLQRHLKRSHPEIDPIEYYNYNILDKSQNLSCPICGEKRKFNGYPEGYSPTCGNRMCTAKYSGVKLKSKIIDLTDVSYDIKELTSFITERIQTVNLKGIQKHIKSKYWNEYLQIIKVTDYLGKDESINFSERLYHIVNNISTRPICFGIIPECTGILKFKNFNDGYQKYCEKCYCKSPEWGEMCSDIQQNRSVEKEQERRKKISESKINWSDGKKEEVDQKKKQTLKENFGDKGLAHPDITEKKKKTHLEKRGVEWATQTPEVQEIRLQTEIDRYNGRWMTTVEAKERLKKLWNEKMYKYVLKLVESRDLILVSDYNNAHDNITLKCKKCNNNFNIMWNSFQQGGGVCPSCFPQHTGTSYQEKQICEYIKSLGFSVIENSKKIIPPYELDMLIEEKMLAIEYCGLWCHSSGGNIPDKFIKPKNYHQTKLELCNKNGYQLITIFEDEWVEKSQIVKNRLKYILGKSNVIRVRASDCNVQLINHQEKRKFLQNHHIQGDDNSTIILGLVYNNKTISIMTFTKPSVAKGNLTKSSGEWELNRFCSDPEFNIMGGAQKLLKYFQNNHIWNKITTFADRRWSEGKLYKTLGFTEVSGSNIEPNYWYWGKCIIGRKHRFNFTKSSLKNSQFYNDDLTEKNIMSLEGRAWIYDCGHLKYELRR